MADPKREPCDKLDVTNFGKSGGIVNGAKWYSVRGGMQDFNYLSSNDFEITLELGCRKYTLESDLEKEWNNNKDSLINFIWQVSLNVLMLYDIVSYLYVTLFTKKMILASEPHWDQRIGSRFHYW